MNKTLTALLTKLSWQSKEINQLLEEITEQLAGSQKKLADKQEQIHKAYSIPAIINPEQEISRLNFIIRCQQEHESLSIEKKELESRQSQLQARQLRLNIEVKMLEKYQLKQQKKEEQKAVLVTQKENDEWVLQRRNRCENQ